MPYVANRHPKSDGWLRTKTGASILAVTAAAVTVALLPQTQELLRPPHAEKAPPSIARPAVPVAAEPKRVVRPVPKPTDLPHLQANSKVAPNLAQRHAPAKKTTPVHVPSKPSVPKPALPNPVPGPAKGVLPALSEVVDTTLGGVLSVVG